MMHQFNNNLKKFKTDLRKNNSLPERIVWYQLLRKKMTGYTFTRQHIVGNYILDFYCYELKLNIELDGNTHDFSFEKDAERNRYLKNNNIVVLRVLNSDVLNNLDGVRVYIEKLISNLSLARSNSAP